MTEEWVNNLKEGNTVYIQPGGYNDHTLDAGTVTKITKTQITVTCWSNNKGKKFNKNSLSEVGFTYSRHSFGNFPDEILPDLPENREKWELQRKQKAIEKIVCNLYALRKDTMTKEQTERYYNLLIQLDKKEDVPK
jgi:hypothetical protein